MVSGTTQLAGTSLRKSADQSKDSALRAANAANDPAISTDTLGYLRNSLIESVKGVQLIEQHAKTTRDTDKIFIAEKQQELLTTLSS